MTAGSGARTPRSPPGRAALLRAPTGLGSGSLYSASEMPRLLVSCGEASGDLYAAELVRHLRQRVEDLTVFGLGGDLLQAQQASLVAHVRDLAVVGLVEVVSHLRHLRRIFRSLLAEVDASPPDAAVLVDYPDFNLRLAARLHRRGIPVVYYVSPQVWAWRRGRLKSIRKTVSRMLVIFPFEEPLYRDAGVPVTFVGHPLVDLVRPAADREAFIGRLGLDPGRPVVALLPGSRPKEVAHNLPPIARAVELLLTRRPDLQFVLALAPSVHESFVREHFRDLPLRISPETYGVLGAATAAVVASGTATVEAALLGAPMVVVYRISPLSYHLGRHFVNVPHYAMVNLIAGRQIVKELIQQKLTGESVAEETLALVENEELNARMRLDLAEVRRRLGEGGASARASEEVLQILTRGSKKA